MKKVLKTGCLILIISLVGGILLSIAIQKCVDKKAVAPKQSEVAKAAPAMIEEAVKALLKAPSSAEFTHEGQSSYANVGDSTAVVTGFVDSQNSFGAMIRTPYRVKLKYIGPIEVAGNWVVLEASLFE